MKKCFVKNFKKYNQEKKYLGRPILLGKISVGASSVDNPAFTWPLPKSMTTHTSDSGAEFVSRVLAD